MPRPTHDTASVRAELRRLYREVDGFQISRAQEKRIARAQSSAIYGEIMPTATVALINALQLGPRDTFIDLGSGVGKVVLVAGMCSGVGRAVGVELARERHGRGRDVIAQAEADGVLKPGIVELRNEDVMKTSLGGATVLYTCSTAFPFAFTERLARRVRKLGRPVRFVTLQELNSDEPGFALDQVLRLDMSWARKRKVHIYRVGGR